LTLAASATALAAGGKFRSPEDALNQGLSAYNGGFVEIAVPALQFAVKHGSDNDSFLARYYLARIYADNSSARTDHARAYELFRRIVDDYAGVDVAGGPRDVLRPVSGAARDFQNRAAREERRDALAQPRELRLALGLLVDALVFAGPSGVVGREFRVSGHGGSSSAMARGARPVAASYGSRR
jgi:hypothetical protein